MVKSKITVRGKIKNRMKVILADRDMTIKDLAKLTDYYYTTIQRFCSSERENVNLLILAKVCEVLNIQPGDVFVYIPPQEAPSS